MVKKWVKKVRKRFKVLKFFGGTNITPSLQEQSADSSEEPTCRPTLTNLEPAEPQKTEQTSEPNQVRPNINEIWVGPDFKIHFTVRKE